MTTTPLSNPTAVKLMIIGRRNPTTTLVEHRQHIRHVHGEMVLQYIAQDPTIAPRRYAQNAVGAVKHRILCIAARCNGRILCDVLQHHFAVDMANVLAVLNQRRGRITPPNDHELHGCVIRNVGGGGCHC